MLDPQLLRDEQATLDASSLTLSKEGLDHLGLLVETLEYDLAGLFELHRQIEKETLETIAFVDLWHLFRHGEKVWLPGPTSQIILRVQHCTGGRQLLGMHISRREIGMYKHNEVFVGSRHIEDKTPVAVQCYLFDFNGIHYGPLRTTIFIQPYVGEKSVTSRAVYPMRFHQHMPTYRDALKERGNKFVELTRLVHMQYKGRSLDNPPEEVQTLLYDKSSANVY